MNEFYFRIAVTEIVLVLFFTAAAIIVDVFGVYNAGLNMLIFILPLLVVYLGTESIDLSGAFETSGSGGFLKSEQFIFLVLSFVAPFIVFLVVIPVIQAYSSSFSQLFHAGITGGLFNSYIRIAGSHLVPSLCFGVAGTAGLLKKNYTIYSLALLAAGYFVMFLNSMGGL
ncbi:hypothetical protein J2128_002332 [Methanomicrobium sp. W14]|uniref:hypothetical protein n=1 Tax=Methanomicrobium sp. W14 TaxID=2817839 RepID=UPI001AE81027|nr:hypothetical protein [Methanomicrobium sp. W14]MBP2134366.1 hypothetical protein [Methanomicrobium sp. W14]